MSNLLKIVLLTGVIGSPALAQTLPEPQADAQKQTRLEIENARLKKTIRALKGQKKIQSQKPPPEEFEMVKLANGLLIGKYEVTQGQWRTVTGDNPSKFISCGDNCPVEQVSWEDVQVFMQRLNSKTGKRYRLPTDSEWTLACQADNSKNVYCGANDIDAVAWYKDNSGAKTAAVGKKQPNAFGLYDMSGNVWEWTSDCDAKDCSRRVIRGGSWFNSPAFVSAAFRDSSSVAHHYDDIGVRLVLDN